LGDSPASELYVPTFRKFRNVNTYNSDVGELPKIKNITEVFLNRAYFAKGTLKKNLLASLCEPLSACPYVTDQETLNELLRIHSRTVHLDIIKVFTPTDA